MHLPVFDLPVPALGIEIPVLMHPPVVHFAIVIPVFILILEIINIFMKRRGLTITTFVFFTLLMVIYFAAFATGKTDGSETWDLLTKAGQEDLKEHKLIGIYLMLSTVVVMFAKLFSMAIKKWWMKLIYLLILVGFVAAVLYQGKEGGELVYKYGANNERVQELGEQVFDLQEELEELKEESVQKESEATEEKSEEPAAPATAEPVKEETKESTPKAAESAEKTEEKANQTENQTQESMPAKETNSTEEAKDTKKPETQESVKEEIKKTAETVTKTAESLSQKEEEKVKEAGDAVKSISDATKGSHE